MYHVRVTTSLLADAATVADGKLYVHGGGWDAINAAALPLTYPSFALALVLDLSVPELTGDKVEIVLVDGEDNRILSVTGHLESGGPERYPNKASVNLPLALPFSNVPFARPGIYTFKVSVAGEQIHSLDFLVQTPAQ